MMKPTSERQRVEQVAAQYRDAGYDIQFDPDPGSLPAVLGHYRPDFVARHGDESVLVEVKTSSTPSDFDRYQVLAAAVEAIPGWRLDLVIAGGPTRIAGVSDYPLASSQTIAELLHTADRLFATEQFTAAVLVGWSACEALLRLLAGTYGLPEQRAPTAHLLKQLVAQGILSRQDYDQVWRTYKARNAVAHGFSVPDTQPIARSVLDLARVLQRDYSNPAAPQ